MEGTRQRRSLEEVERLVEEYEASGLGRQQFCKKHRLSLTTLNRHRKRKQLQQKEAPERRFIPVEISAAKQAASKEKTGELLVWPSSVATNANRAGSSSATRFRQE